MLDILMKPHYNVKKREQIERNIELVKKITMFYFPSCPYCQKALKAADQLRAENPAYGALEIEMIDEKRNPEIADRYDYYYVPTYYVDGKKLHEGAAEKEDVRAVFDAALG